MRATGLEPARRKTPDPKSGVSAIPPRPRTLNIVAHKRQFVNTLKQQKEAYTSFCCFISIPYGNQSVFRS